MKLRAAGLLLAIIGLSGPVLAQDRTPEPTRTRTQKIVCSFCGAERDKGDVCPFCGTRENTPSTEKPAGEPSEGDLPKVAPTPQLKEKAPPPAESKPAEPKKEAPAPSPEDESLEDKAKRAYQDDNVAKGDYYMKTGYYLKASEAYRVAVLAEPVNPWKKLAFGHALFAIGNYSYSSYALRRAISQLDPKVAFNPDVASLFPSKRAFEKAIKDLKRYVTYSPRDAAGLSVLGYMLYAQGEDDRAKEMFVYLQRLPKNENDPFASFFLKQIDARKGEAKTPPLSEPKPMAPEPPKPAPQPPTPPSVAAPEGTREDEVPAKPKPAPARALSE